MRAVLVLAGVAGLATLYLLMLKGWRGRQRRQSHLPAPATDATGTVLVDGVPGLFVGTTLAGRWLDRVAVHGLSDRSNAELTVTSDGVLIEREGAPDLFVPFERLDEVTTTDAHAGKVMGADGLLALCWRLGTTPVTTTFRADDRGDHAQVLRAVQGVAA